MTMYAIVTSNSNIARALFNEICDYAKTLTPSRQDFMLHLYANWGVGARVHNQAEFNEWADDAAAAWAYICELTGAPFILR